MLGCKMIKFRCKVAMKAYFIDCKLEAGLEFKGGMGVKWNGQWILFF